MGPTPLPALLGAALCVGGTAIASELGGSPAALAFLAGFVACGVVFFAMWWHYERDGHR
jgi:uncharacterized membrane protein YccC